MTAEFSGCKLKDRLGEILVTADWSCSFTCTSFERLRGRKTKLFSDLSIQVSIDSLLFGFLRSFQLINLNRQMCMIGHCLGKDGFRRCASKFKTCVTFSNTPCTIAPLPYLVMHPVNLWDFA